MHVRNEVICTLGLVWESPQDISAIKSPSPPPRIKLKSIFQGDFTKNTMHMCFSSYNTFDVNMSPLPLLRILLLEGSG